MMPPEKLRAAVPISVVTPTLSSRVDSTDVRVAMAMTSAVRT